MVVSTLPSNKIKIDVFSDWGNLLYSRDNLIKAKEILLDNEGNVHISRNSTAKKGSYEISSIINNGSLNQTYSLTYDKIVLSSNKIALAKSGNLISCGFYNSTSGPLPGIYSIILNTNTNKVSSEKFKLLSENLLINSMSSGKQNKTKKKMAKGLSIIRNNPKNNYKIMELRPNNDGGFVLIAEHQIIPHKQPFEVVEIYGDLIIAQIGNNGVINNINMIVKDQRQSIFGSTSSFTYINVKSNVCILFNDHKQNINIIDSGQPKQVKLDLIKEPMY